MSAPQIDVFAQTHEKADVRWSGTDRDIPILYVGGVLVHLSQLGSDLRPWLLALSERLAEFAATVSPEDGSKVETRPRCICGPVTRSIQCVVCHPDLARRYNEARAARVGGEA